MRRKRCPVPKSLQILILHTNFSCFNLQTNLQRSEFLSRNFFLGRKSFLKNWCIFSQNVHHFLLDLKEILSFEMFFQKTKLNFWFENFSYQKFVKSSWNTSSSSSFYTAQKSIREKSSCRRKLGWSKTAKSVVSNNFLNIQITFDRNFSLDFLDYNLNQ